MDQAARKVVRRALAEHDRPTVDEPGLVPAGVLVLLYGGASEPFVLLSKRSETVETHRGEISLPGGRWESTDPNLLATALREAEEEVGVRPDDVEMLGELGQFTTSSNFVISAFVGAIDHSYEFKIDPSEVACLVEVPVRALVDGRNLRDDVRVVDDELTVLPSFAYSGHLIFGATARILDRLLEATSSVLLAQPET